MVTVVGVPGVMAGPTTLVSHTVTLTLPVIPFCAAITRVYVPLAGKETGLWSILLGFMTVLTRVVPSGLMMLTFNPLQHQPVKL